MSFFGGGRTQQQQPGVSTTQGGVPLDAVSRLRRMRGEGGPPLFTSDLSVSEFVLLEQMGWRPLGLVLGSSIYHVGIQYGNFYQNQELQYLSAAMYEARELAMSRMEEEADVLGAPVGQLALAHREYARPHDQDDGHHGQQDIEQPVLHQRDPRARAGSSIGVTWISGSRGGATVMVSLGLEMDCGPAEISFSSGRYIMLLPPLVSTMTLREFL